tara:strand:- start:494 stop:1195 length:702 start_codon:yes stop_codon:yes gene_type:complete
MIRNIIFKFFFYFGIIFICILFLPALLLPQKITIIAGKISGFWSKFCLEFFLSTKIIIKGKENLIYNNKFFIACSHQSMFETFFLQTLFNGPIFILKKELTKIPIFGWYLIKIGSISIERNKISKSNLDFLDKIKLTVRNSNRPILIFPQATRLDVNDRIPFKKGVGRIYENLNIKCLPIAINSGSVWPKSGKLIPKKTITVSILREINPGLDTKEFLIKLEKNIYTELDSIA